MERSTTVRLYPLLGEHFLPMLVDVLYFMVAYGLGVLVWGMDGSLGPGLLVLFTVLLVHAAQMAWLVAVRFDDAAITIIRPWRRRRIEWSRIAGLIYTQDSSTGGGRGMYKLRLVLKDAEPPEGRYLTGGDMAPYAKGPVVMTLGELDDDLTSPKRSAQCQNRVYAELAHHGFPRPEPWIMKFRSPRYTPEQTTRAALIDMRRMSAVTVNHGKLGSDGEDGEDGDERLIGTVLPELAREADPDAWIFNDDLATIFAFFTPEPAETFAAAAQALVPAHWRITRKALPELPGD